MESARTYRWIMPIPLSVPLSLAEALGTADPRFSPTAFSSNSQSLFSHEMAGISESELNFMLSVIKDIKPHDQLEAMLAAQMAAVHLATMTSRTTPRAQRRDLYISRTAPSALSTN